MWEHNDWVFTNHVGKPVHPGVDHDVWKRLLKSANVRPARLHDARHTAATMLLVLGVPARAVMDVMGWSNIAMATRYQHMSNDLASTIAEQVETLLWSDHGEVSSERD